MYYEKLEEISELKIFLNVSTGHWKRCGGPHLARGPLFAHPCDEIYLESFPTPQQFSLGLGLQQQNTFWQK